jgi:hypothetical protein
MKLRKCSLFAAVVGALLFTAAFAPRANAVLVVLYNFEDSALKSAPDFTSVGDLGLQFPTMTTNYIAGDMSTTAGLAVNGVTGDEANNLALDLHRSADNNGNYLQFHVNTNPLVGMSLSFAINTMGNGFTSVELRYSNNGFASDTHSVGSFGISSSTGQTITFAIPAAAEGQSDITFRLIFTGTNLSNGNNPQNVIDNVQLNARSVIPEPASVVGALLGACGLCWNQRRRLIRCLCFRHA